MVNKVMVKANKSLAKVKFSVKKKSPEILIVAGVVGVVASAIMACRATTKLPEIMDDLEEKLEEIDEKATDNEEKNAQLTEEEINKVVRKETTMAYAGAAVKVVKIYAPSVCLGALSLTGILASNNILRKRNAALTAAYIAVDQSFKEYRSRVVERFGEEVDKQLKMNIHPEEIEETTTNEKGKEKTVKKTINVADPNAKSPYMKYFTRSNPYWLNDPEQLQFFFRSVQNYLNDKLRVNGHVVLNEAYNALGFHDTKAGMVCGWVNDHHDGDGYIELDIKEVCLPNESGEYEMSYAIDFNVDGSIYDKMV